MQELAAGMLSVRRSRFYAHLYQVNASDDLASLMDGHRAAYKKACHHCHAVRTRDSSTESIEETWNDDGEVGRPGRVLLDLLRRYELCHHVLVVSRIYGGVKLGVGGVARAFRRAGEGAIRHHLDG